MRLQETVHFKSGSDSEEAPRLKDRELARANAFSRERFQGGTSKGSVIRCQTTGEFLGNFNTDSHRRDPLTLSLGCWSGSHGVAQTP